MAGFRDGNRIGRGSFPNCAPGDLFLSIAGFYLAVRTLKHFDAFGVARIMSSLKKRHPREMPFVVEGAYRIVRHPLYFLNLMAIWAYPDLTADRLVFNVLWTIWIVAGTLLEEKDLIREFGDKYIDYKRHVPMLIPSFSSLRAHSNKMEVQS